MRIDFSLPGGSLFKTPEAPPPPIDRAAIVAETAKERARQLRQRRGRQSTTLTSPLGVQELEPLRRASLLGQ